MEDIEREKAIFIERLIAKDKARKEARERIREKKLLYSRILQTIRILKRKDYIDRISSLIEDNFLDIIFGDPELLATPYSDKQVLLGLKTLNNIALSKVYKKSYPEVERMVKRYYGNTMDAEDVFQVAVMILIEKINLGVFNDESRINTYLYKIAYYVWMNELKSGYRNKILVYDRTDLESMRGEITEFEGSIKIEYPEDFDIIREGLRGLSVTCNLLIEAWLYSGEKWDIIAEKLKYANAAVASNQKYKCLQQLKKKIKY